MNNHAKKHSKPKAATPAAAPEQRKRRLGAWWWSAAIAVLVLSVAALVWFCVQRDGASDDSPLPNAAAPESLEASSPLDRFLDGLSEQEKDSLEYYEINEISSAQTQSADSLSERFFEAKVSEMTERLHLTDAQKAEFAPIYRRYTSEMVAAWGGYQRPLHPTTVEEASANLQKQLELQQRALAIRQKYVQQFAAVLDAQQLSRLYSVDNMLQRKVKASQAQRHSHTPRAAQHSHTHPERQAWQTPTSVGKLPARHNHNHGKTFNGLRIPKSPIHK